MPFNPGPGFPVGLIIGVGLCGFFSGPKTGIATTVLSFVVCYFLFFRKSAKRHEFLGNVVKVEAGGLLPAGLAYLLTHLFTTNDEYACYAALVSGMLGLLTVVMILLIRGTKCKRSKG